MNFFLLPFAIESLGKIGKQGYEYINQVAADYGEHYKVATMKRYWFRKISVALQTGIGQTVSNIMNDWLNGKSRDEEQIQDEIDKYQMMDCRILGTASIKGLQEKSFKIELVAWYITNLDYVLHVTAYFLCAHAMRT